MTEPLFIRGTDWSYPIHCILGIDSFGDRIGFTFINRVGRSAHMTLDGDEATAISAWRDAHTLDISKYLTKQSQNDALLDSYDTAKLRPTMVTEQEARQRIEAARQVDKAQLLEKLEAQERLAEEEWRNRLGTDVLWGTFRVLRAFLDEIYDSAHEVTTQ